MIQPERSPHVVSATSRPPLRLRGWRVWAWALLVLGALVTVAIELVALVLIGLSYTSTCYEPAYPPDVVAGQGALLRLAIAVVLPWTLGAVLVRPRLRVALTGLLCTAPATLAWVRGFSTDAWVGGFCF